MSLSSWGNFPTIASETHTFHDVNELRQLIDVCPEVIAYGNGRSYGDSALGKSIITIRQHNLFLDFDDESGMLHVQSGVLLADILETFVPKGWFLKTTPGTKLITVGGAIASDVHGKNHHVDGCFSECLATLNLMLPNGEIVECSNDKNQQLFRATCGGMGLTGVILDAHMSLERIRSTSILQTTFKTRNLAETFDAFETNQDKRFSAAWLDCFATGPKLGRGLVTAGDFCNDGILKYQNRKKLDIPFNFPSFVMNSSSMKWFNKLYYARIRKPVSVDRIDMNSFFYPLDAIVNWNRIYGSAGFMQYQFVLPKDTSYEGLLESMEIIANAGHGSFLAVLKLCGGANDNYLSFPMEGYSLAIDFKIRKGLDSLLNELDQVVLRHGGRLYLAKDARVSKTVFQRGYPGIGSFRTLRKKYGMDQKFHSSQSHRVGI